MDVLLDVAQYIDNYNEFRQVIQTHLTQIKLEGTQKKTELER